MGNKIRFAVIGTEGIGRSHIEGILRNENAVLAALCDVDEAGVKARAEKHGLTTYYTNYKDMLRAGGFDCVVVCSPDSFHKDQCVDSLTAGYHVLCEKPLAMRLDECEAIIAAARASGKKFMVGQVCRKTPAFALMKEMVDRGDIGELFYVESEYAHDYSILGRVLVTPDIFDIIDATPPGAGGEIQLTDAIATLARREGVTALDFEGKRFDLGSKLGFLEANVTAALEHPEVADRFREFLNELVNKM